MSVSQSFNCMSLRLHANIAMHFRSHFSRVKLDFSFQAIVNAPIYFGARHGLETLFQLMEHDDVGGAFVILSNVQIEDYPEYRHRGISVDTSRNFIDPEVLKRIINALAHDKVSFSCSICFLFHHKIIVVINEV